MNKKDLKMIEEALKKSPNNIALRLTYALKLFKLKEFELSEKNYQIVLKTDPSNTKAKQGLVELYFAKENYSAVIVIAEELVKIGAASEKMMELFAKALLRQNSIAEAQEIYERIIKNNPFYFDDELDSVLEDQDEYLSDEDFADDEEDYDQGDDFDNIFDNPFFADDSHLFLEANQVKWGQIIGMDDVKKLVELKSYILTPELSDGTRNKKFNFMLYGPPGCGKTFFVAAVASRFDALVLPVEMDRINDMFMYKPEGRIHFYFAKMRVNKPCILFIDELERFGTSRDQINTFENMQMVGKLTEELDGVRFKNSDQFVIGATNRPWQIDEVLMTPGKFGWRKFVGPPSLQNRIKFFETIKNQHQLSASEMDRIALETKGFSYGELDHLVDMALMEHRAKPGRKKPKPSLNDFLEVKEHIVPFSPTWFETFLQKSPPSMRKEVLDYLETAD